MKKPYIKLAWTLVVLGMSLLAFERFGLMEFAGQGGKLQLDENIWSILVIAPVVLIIAGCIVFMVGRMRRL
jgi:heme/copper-type cytochrome/quinol oxidase subunit 2